ncbi:MAG: DUF937 domain-containing protein [Acidobacteria bacterium]|nr:DUF937 domain-containing protein [Acidobacteriota bacterium]
MNIAGILQEALGAGTVSQIGQAIGVDEQTAGNAIQAALPALLNGLATNSQTEQGASSLLGALDRDHDGSVLDDIAGFIGGAASGSGAGASIIEQLLGGQSGQVAQAVSQASGLDASKVGPLLSILGPIVMGALGRTRQESGFGAGDLAGLLSGMSGQVGGSGGFLGLASQLLDRDGDGSAVDDVAGMLGNFFNKK